MFLEARYLIKKKKAYIDTIRTVDKKLMEWWHLFLKGKNTTCVKDRMLVLAFSPFPTKFS